MPADHLLAQVAQLRKDQREALERIWLPEVIRVADQRKWHSRMLLCLCWVLVAVVCGALVMVSIKPGEMWTRLPFALVTLGILAIFAPISGQAQACEMTINLQLRLAVAIGNLETIIKAIGSIECLGKLEHVLSDVLKLIKCTTPAGLPGTAKDGT